MQESIDQLHRYINRRIEKWEKKARFTVRKLGNIICDTLLQHRHPTMVN